MVSTFSQMVLLGIMYLLICHECNGYGLTGTYLSWMMSLRTLWNMLEVMECFHHLFMGLDSRL
ncbi:hypothetical protein RND81_11G234300 [Saponaria officinalis]|uniref:Uncharacterized protein n=1 Tax=Saponaria officinalis TaxID=3572 RepID=A0AAW1HQK1_SAPOF